RLAVRDALLTIECYPDEQTTFGPDYRSVRHMLEEKLRDCQALIHIVGLRYGAEPDRASLPRRTPRRSYTQLEYDIGRTVAKTRGDKGFRVYTFVCSEDFPYDGADPEPPEKRALQDAHRQAILTGEPVYETVATIDVLKARTLALPEQAIPLRVEQEDLRELVAGTQTDVRKILELLADKTTQRVAG